MRRRLLAAATALSLALALPTSAAGSTARQVADALRDDPVYVAPAVSGLLTVAQRGRVRVRIARRDVGRIQVAVVPELSARRAGGLNEFANAVDQAMPGRRGALVLTTGSAFHVVTSHRVVNPTLAALRSAVESDRAKGLAAQLLAAVDGIAEVDPGSTADLGGPVPARRPTTRSDVGDSFRLGVLIVAGAIALPFLLGAVALLLFWHRRHATSEDREEITLGDARDELVALGEEIRSLDLDVDMPGVSQRDRDDYERALSLYDRANKLLAGREPSEVELTEARRSIAEGHACLAATGLLPSARSRGPAPGAARGTALPDHAVGAWSSSRPARLVGAAWIGKIRANVDAVPVSTKIGSPPRTCPSIRRSRLSSWSFVAV